MPVGPLIVYYLFVSVMTQGYAFDRTNASPYDTRLQCEEARAEVNARLMFEQLDRNPSNTALFITFCMAVDLSKSPRPGESDL